MMSSPVFSLLPAPVDAAAPLAPAADPHAFLQALASAQAGPSATAAEGSGPSGEPSVETEEGTAAEAALIGAMAPVALAPSKALAGALVPAEGAETEALAAPTGGAGPHPDDDLGPASLLAPALGTGAEGPLARTAEGSRPAAPPRRPDGSETDSPTLPASAAGRPQPDRTLPPTSLHVPDPGAQGEKGGARARGTGEAVRLPSTETPPSEGVATLEGGAPLRDGPAAAAGGETTAPVTGDRGTVPADVRLGADVATDAPGADRTESGWPRPSSNPVEANPTPEAQTPGPDASVPHPRAPEAEVAGASTQAPVPVPEATDADASGAPTVAESVAVGGEAAPADVAHRIAEEAPASPAATAPDVEAPGAELEADGAVPAGSDVDPNSPETRRTPTADPTARPTPSDAGRDPSGSGRHEGAGPHETPADLAASPDGLAGPDASALDALAVETVAGTVETVADTTPPESAPTNVPRTTEAGRLAAALPTRLAAPVWMERAAAAGRSIDVALGDGEGSVRLQTRRDADGLAVAVHFTDPELSALANAHARQIAEALEAHFAEPVRLSFGDGRRADAGAGGDRQQARHGRPNGAGPSAPASDPADPPPSRRLGVREWIG